MNKWSRFLPLAAIATASIGALAEPAMAEDTGFYVGANAVSLLSTYRRTDLNNAAISAFGGEASGFALGPTSVNRNHLMWSADVGYMATPNFGLEASFIDLGTLHYSAYGTQTSTKGSASAINLDLNIRSHGPALALVGVLPMTNIWELDARVGVMQAKTITTYRTTVDAEVQSGKLSQSSTSLLASLGTAFTVSSHCTLRVDYLRIGHIKEKGLEGSFNVNAVTAGAAYVF